MNEDNAMLLSLPHEVLQNIFQNVDPLDLASVALTCSPLHTFLEDNTLLYRDLYLQHFDEPPSVFPSRPMKRKSLSEETSGDAIANCIKPTVSLTDFPWKTELAQLIKLRELLASDSREARMEHFEFIAGTTFHLLNSTLERPKARRNIEFLGEYYKRPLNRDTLLCGSSLFAHAGSEEHYAFDEPEHRQLAAKLHCLYGVPVTGEEEGSVPCQPYACSRVYDLRKYTKRTMWGPFRDDGSQRVDWERMETIMIDLNHNIRQFRDRMEGNFPDIWTKPFQGVTPYSFFNEAPKNNLDILDSRRSIPRSPIERADPYNVTGTWLRVVCFLDYRELFAFNFISDPPPDGADRQPLQTQEAFRLIVMKLRATKIEPPGPQDGQALPVVHFTGKAKAISASWDPNANSEMRGQVRLTPEGEIRWTTFSVYGGEERWRSEGIQLGGLQSSRGTLGTWFDKDYDAQGPAGPTAFWKFSDELEANNKKGKCTAQT